MTRQRTAARETRAAWEILALPHVYKCSVKCSREISANLELVWHVNIQKLTFLTFMCCSMAPD